MASYMILCRTSLFAILLWALPMTTTHMHGYEIGIAQIDVTPDYPVRLSGFGFRREESKGITHRIWAKALAIKDPKEGLAVVITVDNLGIPSVMTQEVAQRLNRIVGLPHKRLAITATHTHSAPMLTQVAPTLFGLPIPTAHQHRIDRYTRELTDWLEKVALMAIQDVQPGRMEWGNGEVTFAKNRRTVGGPVDHDMPMMVMRDQENAIRGIWFNYACHCVTLSHNHISGDWAGSAQNEIQRRHPEAIVLASIGCGADQNPDSDVTGDKVEVADAQGIKIADEVDRLLKETLKPLNGPLSIQLKGIPLAFDTPRTREEWEERSQQNNAVGYHAKVNLARLDRGETLPDHIDYPIQTWLFGDTLAMVFLPGEVVVDYSIRLKQAFDQGRIWINAYANDAPCYIPSERILKEGGYEGGGAMIYYDQPNQFAPGLEQQIFEVIQEQIPDAFKVPEGTDGSVPLSPETSLRSIKAPPGMEIELVVAEPLVIDPVAIDWDAQGRMWVVEMNDYPLGIHGGYEPGGRIKVLTDSDKDGQYDQATVFMDGLAFPTGITTWGKGALISAAPDLIYAEDTNGDGRADKQEIWFTGFATDNYQARINSISLGLDNWLYGANGLIGGNIRPVAFDHFTGNEPNPISIRNRDFRFHPWTGVFETVSGLTQQGRVRDDFGNWFGCSNGSLIYHFPVDSSMMRHNPHLTPPSVQQFTWQDTDPKRLFPISKPLQRFNDLDHLNRVTSACGLGIYRDKLLGSEFEGNAFTCEPVHNLVRRTVLNREGNTFAGRRADTEQTTEFLASTDQWFRPSQVRTGPDGALWVVDMYRFLMEHPIWIRPSRMAQLNPRAGDKMGRIYRVYPGNHRPELFKGLTKSPSGSIPHQANISTEACTSALSSSNGTVRDLAHQHLLLNNDTAATSELERLAQQSSDPSVRVQSLCLLEGLNTLKVGHVVHALKDRYPGVRTQAARLSQPFTHSSPQVLHLLIALLEDPDAMVRTQAAGSLHTNDSRGMHTTTIQTIGTALGNFLLRHASDPYASAAAWSASIPYLDTIADVLLKAQNENPTLAESFMPTLIQIAAGAQSHLVMTQIYKHISQAGHNSDISKSTFTLLTHLGGITGDWNLINTMNQEALNSLDANVYAGITKVIREAQRQAPDTSLPADDRQLAIGLLGWDPSTQQADLILLMRILDEQGSDALSKAVFKAFSRFDTTDLAKRLLNRWSQSGPGIRRAMIHVMLQRVNWTTVLLSYATDHPDMWHEIPSTRRSALLRHHDPSIKSAANSLQNIMKRAGRDQILAEFEPASRLTGDTVHGKELFSQRCAICHLLDGLGRNIGPDLLSLSDKSPKALMDAIIDPNRAVLDQYTVYEIETKDGRSLSGAILDESSVSLRLKTASGEVETINRGTITSTRTSGLSLMPEGLEEGLSHQDMADLTTFIARAKSGKEPSPRDPGVIANYLLDENAPLEERKAAVKVHYMLAVELIREMVRDLPVGTPEEYRRIPWIWRVAIQTGRENHPQRIRQMLHLSLPQPEEAFNDWQSVVIGGGIINGLSLTGEWPKDRLYDLIGNDEALLKRMNLSLTKAAKMADDASIPSGTRYDALRMLAMGDVTEAIQHLKRYLKSGIDPELQMGAISGLADIKHPGALSTLESAISHLTSRNLELAQKGVERLRSHLK